MSRFIDAIDRFMRSERGMQAIGTAAAVILVTSIASFGANDQPNNEASSLTNQPGDGIDIPLSSATPVQTGDGARVGSAGGGPGGGPTLSGGNLSTPPPKVNVEDFDFGLRTQGVTDKEVKVGFSYNQAACGDSGALQAALGAATVGDIEKSINTFARHINDTGGVGGRKYVPQFFDDGGSGCPEKSLAAAVDMADESKVFIAVPGLHVVSDYVISRKVPVFGGRDDPASLAKYGPNGISLLEPIEPTLEAWASFGKYYLGSDNVKSPPCLVRIESGASGNWDIPQKILVDKMAKYGLKFRDILVFKDDASTAQQQATAAALRLEKAGCKEVWFMAGNPIGLIFFTNAATQQQWFPKWTFTSYTALSDTELAGNLMDQQQWENAIGLSIRVPPGKHPSDGKCKKIYQKYNSGDGQEGSAAVLLACVTVLPTAEAMRRGIARTGVLNSTSLLIGADAIRDDFYYDAHVPMSFSFPNGGPYKTRGFTHWTVVDWSSAKKAYDFPKFPCYWKTFQAGLAGCEDLRPKFR